MQQLFTKLLAALGILMVPVQLAQAETYVGGRGTVVSEHPLARRPAESERLVLSTTEGETRLLVRPGGAASHMPALPVLADLLGHASAVPFGSEERCLAHRVGADMAVSCGAGSRAAGILLRFEGRLPRGAAIEAVLRTSGGQGYSAQFTRSGEEANAALPIDDEQRFALVGDDEAPDQLVILAPPGGGSLRITGLHLAPTEAPRAVEAGAWAWEPDLWQAGGIALIRDASGRRVTRLYISLTISDGRVQRPWELIRFVRAAGRAGIEVEAVEGDPRMVLEDGLTAALGRAQAIAHYQENAPADAQLAGVQYDIEPYILPEWENSPADYRAWSAAVNRLAQAVGGPVHLVLPFWITNEEAGVRFLSDVAGSVSAISVMSYRTDIALVSALAEPLLHWGGRAGKPVRLALESGPVAAETEESFAPANVGRLAVVEKDGTVTALLLSREGVVAGALMYASEGTVQTRPETISFMGDEARMLGAARDLAPAFSAWNSFAGIDYHGLVWRDP